MGHAVGLHPRDRVGDEGVPVAHADVDGLAGRFFEKLGLAEGPAGEGRAPPRVPAGVVAKADFGVAVLQLFDDVRGHGAAAGDFVEVLGHVAQLVRGAVGEQEDGCLCGVFDGYPPPPT